MKQCITFVSAVGFKFMKSLKGHWFLVLLWLLVIGNLYGQKRNIDALRIQQSIKIDGKLDESAWTEGVSATDFTQSEPNVGQASRLKTEVFIKYDNSAVYLGYKLHDTEPSKILREFSLRDNPDSNAEMCSVFFDPFNSGLHGFLFIVSAAGVQSEAIVSNQNEDFNWNAIWESAVQVHDNGWTVEMKIPFSAIRFPQKNIQDWGINFGREIRRYREQSFWSFIDPTISGWVQQSGMLTGVKDITSPFRLSLTPYISGYYNIDNTGERDVVANTAYNAGLDLKYGINDAFTLDMTAIPDFGQVISDKKVLNLSAFEVFFEENRQFFTEGTELFNKGNLFYSRRIGQSQPFHLDSTNVRVDEVVTGSTPSKLLNATKISGRMSNGTGLGFLNAISGPGYTELTNADGIKRKVKTQPLTNYNVLVFDRNLKNNSSVYLMNTNVTRFGEFIDANVTGGGLNLRTKNQKYATNISGSYSNRSEPGSVEDGFKYDASWGKISGNWTYEVAHGVESVYYNPNDLGFLRSPNEFYTLGYLGYANYKPKNTKMQVYRFSFEAFNDRLYQPNVFTATSFSLNSFCMMKTRNAFGFYITVNPWGEHNYFEPRVRDYITYLKVPILGTLSGLISTDYRKPIALDINAGYDFFDQKDRKNYYITVSPRVRFNNRFSVTPSTYISIYKNDRGYVNKAFTSIEAQDQIGGGILFGDRDRVTVENSISAKYIFTAKMGVKLRIRHYWDNVLYSGFGTLASDGTLDKVEYNGIREDGTHDFDQNFNLLNIDLQYNWRFAPGSDLVVVWKNEIFNSNDSYKSTYVDNVSNLFEQGQSNSLSMRLLYYLDYLYLFPKK